MVIAHRGCWKQTSENSLDAIRSCIRAGVDMVELDVRATRDGRLILMHDDSVDRMTNGAGKVADLDWAELRKLRLREGRGGGSALTRRRIPTFEQALRVARNRILINVDAKVLLPPSTPALIDAVSDRRQLLFKAEASVAMIERAAPWAREVRFQPILREPNMAAGPAAAIAAYDPLRPVSYEIDVKHVEFTPTITQTIQGRCARYWVNSLAGRVFDDRAAIADPDVVWGRMILLGVDAIQTDEPLALVAYLKRTGAHGRSCSR